MTDPFKSAIKEWSKKRDNDKPWSRSNNFPKFLDFPQNDGLTTVSNFQYTVRTIPNKITQSPKSPLKGSIKEQHGVHIENKQNGEDPCTNQIKPSIESKPDMYKYNNKNKQSKPKKEKEHPDQKETRMGLGIKDKISQKRSEIE